MIGRRLSHYDVIESLGAGGMGEVYRAHDSRLNRDVAIKVLPSDRPLRHNARLRFKREAMAASALNHPNIITIYEINNEGNVDFIVMEYVRGLTLSSMLKKRKLNPDEAARYCIQIADAVAKAHAAGVVHRDLKPGNVMITEDGLVKVLDFGLAKFTDPTSRTGDPADTDETQQVSLTQPGSVTGTAAYMSPEQARGDKVDSRSDIFSFGIVTFELFSGQLPFAGPNSMAVLHNLHFTPPRDLTKLRPDLPAPLVALISRMLEKDVDKRIQTMGEVANELRRSVAGMVDGPLTWQPGAATIEMARTAVPPARKFNRTLLWAGGLIVLVALAAGAGHFYKKTPASQTSAAGEEAPVEDNAYALYQRARDYLDHSDHEEKIDAAIKLLQRAVELDPKSAASYAALGEAYYAKNSHNPDPQWMKQASEASNRAVTLDNYLAAGHVSLGLAKQGSGDSAEAEKQFLTASDLAPKNSAAFRDLGSLHARLGKRTQAVQELNHALQLNPKDWKSYMNLGSIAFQAADYKGAASDWEQALKIQPDSLTALQNLSGAYHLLERDDDAAEALQRALAMKPSAEIYNNLGTIRFYQGHYNEAVPAFEKTVELNANAYDSWGNLGDAYRWSSSQKDKAKPAYAHAIQLVREEIAKHPEQLELRTSLAMYLAKSGDKQNALRELKAVEQANIKDPNLLYVSAMVYEMCDNRNKALDSLLASVKAGQSLADIKTEPEFVSLRADPRYHLDILGAATAASDH